MDKKILEVWTPDGWPWHDMKPLQAQSFNIVHHEYGWSWETLYTDLMTCLAQGKGPDILEIGNTWTQRLLQEGALLNVTEFASQRLKAASTFFPRTLYSCRDSQHPDQYYALPLLADVRVLFYNILCVQDYLDRPSCRDAFKSWEAFHEMCLQLRDKHGWQERVIGWPQDHDSFHNILPWVWAAGGDFVTPLGEALINSERTRIALYRLAHLVLTGCASLNPLTSNHDAIRSQFTAGNLGMTTGALWLTHEEGWSAKCRAVLHPPDIFPATFVGASNIAIVRKHGDANEHDEAYRTAKDFVQAMLDVEIQMVAKDIGKLPCNITAWKQMFSGETDPALKAVLETFNDALCYTVDRVMPNLVNYVQIEEELKRCISDIWSEVGKIRRRHFSLPLEQQEAKCKEAIDKRLNTAQQEAEKYLTGYTVIYNAEQLNDSGLRLPEQNGEGVNLLDRFDLIIEVSSHAPRTVGQVYVKHAASRGTGKITKGIGPNPFHVLYALATAPKRTLSLADLLEKVWKKPLTSRAIRMADIEALQKELDTLLELFQLSRSGIQPQATVALLEKRGETMSAKDKQEHLNTVQKVKGILEQQLQRGISKVHPNLFQERLVNRLSELSSKLEELTNESERRSLIETLRETIRSLNSTIGKVKSKQVISRLEQHGIELWQLDADLTVCIVEP